MHVFRQIKKNIKYYLFALVAIPFLFGSFSGAVNDLLWQAINPTYENKNISQIWENVDTVWNAALQWWIKMENGLSVKSAPSIIIKVTRILLSLTIALAVTMILYNGMMYIVKTWQWKDWKDLTKNVAYIVVWILIALFSVVIITLIRSVPKTLDEELIVDYENTQDDKIMDRWKKISSFGDILKKIL